MRRSVRVSFIAPLGAILLVACSDDVEGPVSLNNSAPITSSIDGGSARLGGTQCGGQLTSVPAVKWVPPHQVGLNLCTPKDAAAIVTCMVQNKNCDVPVDKSCQQCMVSDDQTSYSSPLVVSGNQVSINFEGCVGALSGDPSANGCGARLVAREMCEAQVCGGCRDEASAKACFTAADNGPCAQYVVNSSCAKQYLPTCLQGQSDAEIAFTLAKIFCGPPMQ